MRLILKPHTFSDGSIAQAATIRFPCTIRWTKSVKLMQCASAYPYAASVVFPMNNLKPGEHTTGQTVAELGNWNVPLDIIQMEKEGKSYLLMANSSRAVMKISVDQVANFNDSLTEKVAERSGTAGVDFINLPFVNVQQLAKLSDSQFIMLQRKGNGDLDLLTQNNRWL